VLTLTTSHNPAPSVATFANSGATILHGLHQEAQKSTRTTNADRLSRASKTAHLAFRLARRVALARDGICRTETVGRVVHSSGGCAGHIADMPQPIRDHRESHYS
jgi:hypothetical protein